MKQANKITIFIDKIDFPTEEDMPGSYDEYEFVWYMDKTLNCLEI